MLSEKLTPKQLVLKHIFDKNHVVTEEEFVNMKVGVLTTETKEKENSEEPQLADNLILQ